MNINGTDISQLDPISQNKAKYDYLVGKLNKLRDYYKSEYSEYFTPEDIALLQNREKEYVDAINALGKTMRQQSNIAEKVNLQLESLEHKYKADEIEDFAKQDWLPRTAEMSMNYLLRRTAGGATKIPGYLAQGAGFIGRWLSDDTSPTAKSIAQFGRDWNGAIDWGINTATGVNPEWFIEGDEGVRLSNSKTWTGENLKNSLQNAPNATYNAITGLADLESTMEGAGYIGGKLGMPAVMSAVNPKLRPAIEGLGFAALNIPEHSDMIEQRTGEFRPKSAIVSGTASGLLMSYAFAMGKGGLNMTDAQAMKYAQECAKKGRFGLTKDAAETALKTMAYNAPMTGTLGTAFKELVSLPSNYNSLSTEEKNEVLRNAMDNIIDATGHELITGGVFGLKSGIEKNMQGVARYNEMVQKGRELVDPNARKAVKTDKGIKYKLKNFRSELSSEIKNIGNTFKEFFKPTIEVDDNAFNRGVAHYFLNTEGSKRLLSEEAYNKLVEGPESNIDDFIHSLESSIPVEYRKDPAVFDEALNAYKDSLIFTRNIAVIQRYAKEKGMDEEKLLNRYGKKEIDVDSTGKVIDKKKIADKMRAKMEGLKQRKIELEKQKAEIDKKIQDKDTPLPEKQELAQQAEEVKTQSDEINFSQPYTRAEIIESVRDLVARRFGNNPQLLDTAMSRLSEFLLNQNGNQPIGVDDAIGLLIQIESELSKLNPKVEHNGYNSDIEDIISPKLIGNDIIYNNDERGALPESRQRGALPESRQLDWDSAEPPILPDTTGYGIMPSSVMAEPPVLPTDGIRGVSSKSQTQANNLPIRESVNKIKGYEGNRIEPNKPTIDTERGQMNLKANMPRENMNISQPKEQLPINDRISGKSTRESPSSFKESTSSLNIPQASKSENVPPKNKMKIDSTNKVGNKAVRDSESFDTRADMPQSVMTDRSESPAIKNERGKMGLDVEMKQKEAPKTETKAKAEFNKKVVTGKRTKMTTKANGGMEVDGEFAVVDVNDLETSVDIGETQNRNRNTIASQAQINSIANNPNPDYLLVDNADSANGAMVVMWNPKTKKYKVLSGNGRTLGLTEAYKYGKADKYQKELNDKASSFDIDKESIGKIKNPVLVRIIEPKDGFDVKRFVKESNESQQLARNAAEIARTDAENIKGILRDFNSVEDIASSSNKEFIQKFFDKTVGNTERAMYLAEDGSLTPDGRRRVENALIASLYGDNPRLIEKLTNTTNEGIKNIANALISTARDGAKLKGEIDKGNFFDIDFTKEIGDAALAYADTIAEMKRQGVKPLDSKGNGTSPLNFYLKNMKDRLTPESKLIFGVLSNLHKSPKQTREFLQIINDVIRAHGDPQQGDLFTGKNQKPSKSQVIKEALQEFDSRYKTDFSKRDLSEWNKLDRTLFGSRAKNKVTNPVSDKDLNNFLKGQAKQITKETGLNFKVVDSVEELSKIAGEQLDAKTEGGIQNDTVYIVRGNVDKERFSLFIVHEVAGHRGVEALFDSKEQMDSFFKSLERASDRDRFISDAFAEVDRLGYTKNRSREAMAKIVEYVKNESGTLKGTAKTFVNFIASRVRRFLRKLGFKNLQLNEAEVYDIAVQALRRTGLKNSNKFFGLDRFLAKDNSFLSATSTELDKKYPNWLKDQEKASGAHSTQIEQTKETYKKIGEFMKQNGMGNKKILDASSGMGYGTEELRKMGFDIEDVEPYPGDDREFKPTYGKDYKDYKEIYRKHGKTYDVIISNAVLNVIPDDWRREQLHAMADVLLKDGGKIFLNVRDTKEIENQTQKIELDSPREILVTNAKGDKITAYQRGFDQAELEYWLTKELGRGYTVEAVKESNSGLNKGTRAVVITKNSANANKTAKQVRNDITKRLTPDQLANREFNNSAQPMSGLKTLKSKKNTLGRYKGIVGKDIGDQLYVHKNYADEVIPVDKLNKARQILSQTNPDFKYKTIMWDKKKGTIRFDEAPNFDTAPEPIPGVMITVDPETGNIRKSYSQNIWHHKWQWVKDDYKGFDTRKSWERSREWLNGLADLELDKEDPYFGVANKGVANGRQLGYGGWNDQLYYYGLDHMIDDTNNTVPLDSYKEGLKVMAEQKAIDKALKASMPKEAKPKKSSKSKKAEGEFLASRPRTREEARSPKEFYGEKRWNAIKSYKKNKGVVDNLLPTIDYEAYEGYEKLPDGIQAMQNITNNGELLADLDHALKYHYKSDIIDTLNHIKERVAQTYDEKFANKIAKRCDRIIRMTEKGEYDASKIKPISLKELEKQKIKEMPKTDWDLDREYYEENDLIDPITQRGHGWVQRGDGSYDWLSSIGEKSPIEDVAGKASDEIFTYPKRRNAGVAKKILDKAFDYYEKLKKGIFKNKKLTDYNASALKTSFLTGYDTKEKETMERFKAIGDFNKTREAVREYIDKTIPSDKRAKLLDSLMKQKTTEGIMDIAGKASIEKERAIRNSEIEILKQNLKDLKANKISAEHSMLKLDALSEALTQEELDGLLNTNDFSTGAVKKMYKLLRTAKESLKAIESDEAGNLKVPDKIKALASELDSTFRDSLLGDDSSPSMKVSVETLAKLNHVLKDIKDQSRIAKINLAKDATNEAYEAKEKIVKEMKPVNEAVANSRETNRAGLYKTHFKPISAMNTLDLDNFTSEMGETMNKVAYKDMLAGQKRKVHHLAKGYRIVDDIIESFGKDKEDGIDNLNKTFTTVETADKHKYDITRDEAMAIYAMSTDRETQRIIKANKGLTLYLGDKKGSDSFTLSLEKLNEISKNLTSKEKEAVMRVKKSLAQDYLPELNAVHERLNGVPLRQLVDETYFPRTYMEDSATSKGNGVLDGLSAPYVTDSANADYASLLKHRGEGAQFRLRGLTKTYENYVDQASNYIGMAEPLKKFNRILDKGMEKEITQRYGAEYVDRLKRMTELNAGMAGKTKEDKQVLSRYLSNIAAAKLTPVSALKQFSSVPLASSVIPFKYLAKAMVSGLSKENIAEMMKLDDMVLRYRDNALGGIMPLNATNMEAERSLGTFRGKNPFTKAVKWGLNLSLEADKRALGIIYKATKLMAEAQGKGNDSAWIENKFMDAVRRTQNTTDLASATGWQELSRKSSHWAFLNMYLNQTQKLPNEYIRLKRMIAQAEKAYGKDSAQYKEAKGNMVNFMIGMGLMNAMSIGLGMGAGALLNKDDEKKTGKETAAEIMTESLFNFTGNPIIKPALGGSGYVLQKALPKSLGGKRQRTTTEAFGNDFSGLLPDATYTTGKIFEELDSNDTAMNKLRKVTQDALGSKSVESALAMGRVPTWYGRYIYKLFNKFGSSSKKSSSKTTSRAFVQRSTRKK